MGVIGEVTSLHGSEAEVAVSGKRLRVPRPTSSPWAISNPRGPGGRRPPSSKKPAAAPGVFGASRVARARGRPRRSAKQVPAEVNLIGLTVEDARERVDKLLDDAALSDRREIRLVHGFGEGKLRKAVAQTARAPPARLVLAPGRPERGRRRGDGRGAQGLMAFPESFVEEVRRVGGHRARHLRPRGAQEDGHLVEGPVPVPPGEEPVVQRAPGAGRLPLLRLRRGRRRLQVPDAARADELPRGGRDAGAPLRRAGARGARRARARPQGARGAARADGGGGAALHAHVLGGARARRRASTCSAAASARRRSRRSAPAPRATPGTICSARCAASSRRRCC